MLKLKLWNDQIEILSAFRNIGSISNILLYKVDTYLYNLYKTFKGLHIRHVQCKSPQSNNKYWHDQNIL